MNNIETTRQKIKESGIIAILRGDFLMEDTFKIGDALLDGGVTTMEITLNSPSALRIVQRLREHFGSKLLVGIGTVRDVSGARRALEAGAQFLVSPCFDAATATFAQSQDVLHLPGVFTATEAQTAFAAGCRMLKLFPMDFSGPAYLKVLRAPLDDIDFVPTGGVTLTNIGAYASAGAAAVGVGGQLVKNLAEITFNATTMHQIWQANQKQ
jgi:2-dehydro-3-deoxyphosphogluconate aldolase/(4S)-4-hydroxy-2-oxoglutarate aldolase